MKHNKLLFCLIYYIVISIQTILSIKCNDKCFNSNSKYQTTNCFCRNDCHIYNDCCIDFKINITHFNENVNLMNKNFDCNVRLTNYKWIYSINKCNRLSLNSHHRDLIEKCESNKQNGLIHLVPVYYQNQTYKNVYCFLCNNYEQSNNDADDVKFYELNMDNQIDDNLEQMMNNYSNLSESILLNVDFLAFNLPNVTDHRYCVKSIDTCSLNSSSFQIDDEYLCKNQSTAYRYYLDDDSNYHIYKNEHCAKCNGINLNDLRCQMIRPKFFHQNLQILFDLKSLHGELKIELNIRSDNLNRTMTISNDAVINLQIKTTINTIKNITTFVGQIISIISLILLLSIYFTNQKLRNLGGKILISLCISLLLSQIMFLISGLLLVDNLNESICFLIGLLTHYFYLVFFFWTNVMSYDLFIMFNKTNVNTDEKKFIKYSIYAWFMPFIIIILNLMRQLYTKKSSYASKDKCFISNSLDLLVFFILPIFCILLTNCYYLFSSIRSISQVDKSSRKYLTTNESTKSTGSQNNTDQKKRIFLYLKLFLLFGMTWSLGIINSIINNPLLWYAYIVLNSFQGLFIFISFTFNSQTKRHLKNMQWYSFFASRNGNSSSNTKSTSLSAVVVVIPPQSQPLLK